MSEAASQRTVTAEQVADIGRCQSKLPREADFIGRKGYSRRYRPDGSYTWKWKFQQNDKGKRTRDGAEVLDRMTPFMKADTERHAKLQAKKERMRMRDRDGRVRLIEPALADRAAQTNGWSHVVSVSGSRVEGGVDGMLWKWIGGRDGWKPLGRWCMGTPWTPASRPPTGRRDGTMKPIGVQHDPDGNPWRWVADEWRRVA